VEDLYAPVNHHLDECCLDKELISIIHKASEYAFFTVSKIYTANYLPVIKYEGGIVSHF
jgi:hypothetical protein